MSRRARRYRPRSRVRGQALSETLLSMLVLVPLFILIPYIGKYLDVKHRTSEATRYALWERTIFSDPGASWGAGENQKSDADIALELGDRVLGNPAAPVLPVGQLSTLGVSVNPLWVDFVGDNLIAASGFGAGAPVQGTSEASVAEENEPVSYGLNGGGGLIELVAFDGLPVPGFLSRFVPLGDGLGLNEQGFAVSQVTVPLVQLPTFEATGVSTDIQRPAADATPISMGGSGAILSDSWVPGSEGNYQSRVDGLVVDEILQLLVLPGTLTFGITPFFFEGFSGFNPQLETESNVIPEFKVNFLDLLDPF